MMILMNIHVNCFSMSFKRLTYIVDIGLFFKIAKSDEFEKIRLPDFFMQ